MTVAQLIEELKRLPPDAEVYIIEGPNDDEVEPSPCLCEDGSVRL